MELPPELREWSDLLLLLQPDLSLVLGGMVRRLATVFGSATESPMSGSEEPDGFSGLSTRGSYERLLPGEWLLASEMPHEFQRRAVMGEHVFYQRALVQPAKASMSVALFDCGPGQLGAPRIAHLALLIVLQRRAQAAGLDFTWGTLQNSQLGLYQALNRDNISQVLQARSLFDPQPWALEDWATQIGTLPGAPELWIIRSPETSTAPLIGHEVVFFDSDVPGTNALSVEITRGNRLQQMELPLPTPENAVRLLRNPFRRDAIRSAAGANGATILSGLLFSQNAKRLAVLHASGGVSIYLVPNRPVEDVTLVRYWEPRPGYKLAGMRLHRKQITALAYDSDSAYLDGFTGGTFGNGLIMLDDSSEMLTFGAAAPSLRMFQVNAGEGGKVYIYLVDDQRRLILFEVDRDAKISSAEDVGELGEEVIDAAQSGDLLWVALNGESLKLQCHKSGRMIRENIIASTTSPSRQVRWLSRTLLPDDEQPLLAYTSGSNDWIIRRPFSGPQQKQPDFPLLRVTVPADAEVLGLVIMREDYFGSADAGLKKASVLPSLAYLTPDRRYLVITSRRGLARTELHEPGGIHQPVLHGSTQMLAYRSSSGEVIVYSIRRQQQLLRLAAVI